MKKNMSWKFTNESSITFQLSVSRPGEFSHRRTTYLFEKQDTVSFIFGKKRTEMHSICPNESLKLQRPKTWTCGRILGFIIIVLIGIKMESRKIVKCSAEIVLFPWPQKIVDEKTFCRKCTRRLCGSSKI